MNEETFHVARKEEVTEMAGPDLLSYRIQNYQSASSPIQQLSAQTSLWGSPPSPSEALNKTMSYLSVLYLCMWRNKKANVYWLLAMSQPLWCMFSHWRVCNHPIKWAWLPSFHRAITSLAQEGTNIRWQELRNTPRLSGWSVWWLLTFLLSRLFSVLWGHVSTGWAPNTFLEFWRFWARREPYYVIYF